MRLSGPIWETPIIRHQSMETIVSSDKFNLNNVWDKMEKPVIVKYLSKDLKPIKSLIPDSYKPVEKVKELSNVAKADLRLRGQFQTY